MFATVTTGRVRKISLHRRAWAWARGHPTQAIGMATGALAFLRLIALSHGRLGTARALLEHAALVELAGGLVVSATLIWVPMFAALVAFAGLSVQKNPASARTIGVGLALATPFGLFAFGRWQDLDFNQVAQGGPPYLLVAGGLGVVLGSALQVTRTERTARSSAPDTVRDATPDTDTDAVEPDAVAVEPDAVADGAVAVADGAVADGAVVEPGAEGETSPEPGDDPAAGAWAVSGVGGDPVPDEKSKPSRRQRGLADASSALKQAVKSAVSNAGGFGSFLLVYVVVGLFVLLAVGLIALLFLLTLMEPSQPPENFTVAVADTTVTETVHVIDDDGEYWLVMRRGDRTVLTVKKALVIDRYVCQLALFDPRITDEVRLAGFGSMWGRSTERGPARPSDIVERGEGDDLDAEYAREWVEAVLGSPPPCGMEFSSEELARVRDDLGYDCHDLARCVKRPDSDS